MNFICDNCKKVFSVKGQAARIMMTTNVIVCSPECAAKLLTKERP